MAQTHNIIDAQKIMDEAAAWKQSVMKTYLQTVFLNHKQSGITMKIQLQPEFDDVLQTLGSHALEFFLAASLYHARKISFASAAHMAGLDFGAFKTRLSEHFDQGYIIADECVLEDIHTVENL